METIINIIDTKQPESIISQTWSSIKNIEGQSKEIIIATLIGKFPYIRSSVHNMLIQGQLEEIEGNLYTYGNRYMTATEIEIHKAKLFSEYRQASVKRDTYKPPVFKEIKYKKESDKDVLYDTIIYAHGVIDKDGSLDINLILNVDDKEYWPDNTVFIYQLPAVSLYVSDSVIFKVNDQHLKTIEIRSGIKNLKFQYNKFTYNN